MVDLNVNKLCELKNLDNYYAWIAKKFASKVLLENPKLRRVHAIACNPEAPQIYEELGEILWNSYQPTDITPKEGDVNIFLNHIDYLFSNEKEKDHLLNWLAYCIQNPGKKIKHVVLITGGQGIGKTFIFKCMQRMLGKKNCLAVSQDQVLNKFNSFLTTCIFLACEEIHIPGDEKKQQQYMNKFKPLITEDEIMIEPKGVNAYIAKNNFNMIMFSNERSPINVEKTDRRFFILNTDARQREEKYYEELWGWLENEGDQKLLNWMQRRNLSNFNPNAKAPMTDAKYDIRINSLTKAEEWFENAFNESIIPFTHKDIICPTHLWEYGKDSKECIEKQEFFRRKLIEKGYRKIRQVELLDKSKPALYALKDKVEILSKMSNDELRRKYLKPVFIRGIKKYLKYDSNVFYDESYDKPF